MESVKYDYVYIKVPSDGLELYQDSRDILITTTTGYAIRVLPKDPGKPVQVSVMI
jgi:hypothetical protein